jgi:hypothetical protein
MRWPLVILVATSGTVAAGPATVDSTSVSVEDTRFASQIGSLATPSSSLDLAARSHLPVEFRGTNTQSCASVDFNTFLHRFDPNELLAELRQSLLSGAQSAVSNFLVMLAYSAPTLTSVLDMSDRQLGARFNAFAQTCASQQLRAAGPRDALRRLADAGEQCFAQEVARGTPPTGAFRRCSVFGSFEALTLPASLSTLDFVRRHSDLAISPRIELLFGLLPDERIVGGNYQVRPPKASLHALSDSVRIRSRLALDQLLDGSHVAVAECASDSIADTTGLACLPHTALGLVDSPSFRAARFLGPVARSMFKDALSGQIAVTALYADLLDLSQRIKHMNLRSDSGASADEMSSRRNTLRSEVKRLLEEADVLVALEEMKLRSTRTQMLAVERVQRDFQSESEAMVNHGEKTSPALLPLLRIFQDRN